MKRITSLEKKYVQEVLNSQFSASNATNFNILLEKLVCKKFKCKYVIPLANGTAGLHVALLSFDIKKGDEVIVPSLTMSSTAISVILAGGTPVFADIDPDTFTIDPKSIKNLINNKTKGIIAVSVYGLMPNYNEIKNIVKKNKLFLIEDNAECFLGKDGKNVVGSYGDYSMYSFQSSKHITSGNGGILTTNNKKLWIKARQIGNLGYPINTKKLFKRENIQDPNFSRHILLGLNYRLPELCAAVAFAQMQRIDELVNIRIDSAKLFIEVLKKYYFVRIQKVPKNFKHTYWSCAFILDINSANDWYNFKKLFNKNGGDFFYSAWKPTYMEPFFSNYKKIGNCPVAEYSQKRLIQLKTNYWDRSRLKTQVQILDKTLKQFSKNYVSKNI